MAFHRRIGLGFFLIACLGLTLPARGQADLIQKHLNSLYKGKDLLLRNFYIGDNLSYDGDGILEAGKDAPGPWPLAGGEIKEIGVGAQGVDSRGSRLAILFNKERQSSAKTGTIRIHIARPITQRDSDAVVDAAF